MGIDVKDVLQHAKFDIQQLRQRNQILEAKVEVIEVFKAALLGADRTGRGESVDVLYRIEEAIESIKVEQRPTTQEDLDRETNTPGDCGQ